MAKSRMTSQEIAEDSKVGRLSDQAALTYAFTIPFLDRDGLCSGKPSWIAGRALQERPHLQPQAGSIIQEWIAQGLVVRYEGNDGPVLFFPGFRKHNANMPYDKEARSKYPPPPGYHRTEHGLIPDDPHVAGHLADAFDTRSNYHKALMEAQAKGERDLATDLGLGASAQDLHNKVATPSRPTPDLVDTNTNRSRTEHQDQHEVKENNTNGALRDVTLWQAEVAGVGVEMHLPKMDVDQEMALLSWLWLFNGWNQEDFSYRDIFRRAYKRDPFVGMDNPFGVMITRAKARQMAPLHADDRREMMAALEPVPEAQEEQTSA